MTADRRRARATSADELCREAYAASAGPAAGVALVAVGGYGRGALAPHSDLDGVLVHDDGVDLGDLGSSLWYPLWDSGRRLDHSVRSMGEVVDAAGDLRVALGLLDVRHLAGDLRASLAQCRVLGENAVYVVDGSTATYTNIAEEGEDRALAIFDVRLNVLSHDDTFDLATRSAAPGRAAERELVAGAR